MKFMLLLMLALMIVLFGSDMNVNSLPINASDVSSVKMVKRDNSMTIANTTASTSVSNTTASTSVSNTTASISVSNTTTIPSIIIESTNNTNRNTSIKNIVIMVIGSILIVVSMIQFIKHRRKTPNKVVIKNTSIPA